MSKNNKSAKVNSDAVLKVCQRLIEHGVEFGLSMNRTTGYGEFVVNKRNYNTLTTILATHVTNKPKQIITT
jgi:CRISPR/Cas system CSM-associated protein Csm4 (group 5 of RAMP superfamily)